MISPFLKDGQLGYVPYEKTIAAQRLGERDRGRTGEPRENPFLKMPPTMPPKPAPPPK